MATVRVSAYAVLMYVVLLGGASIAGADFRVLSRVHTVYILGMPNGLNQFLANRLTSSGIVWVVLDPARADAILTDRLDDTFWGWLNARYPLERRGPIPASNDDVRPRNLTAPSGRIRGTLFLVDPKSRLVLWSCYDQAKTATADELDHVAVRVTKQLKSSLQKK